MTPHGPGPAEDVSSAGPRPAPGPSRVLVVADSDSYVKYGAALAEQLPASWSVRIVVAAGNAVPSPRQLADAVAGTRFVGADVPVVGLGDLRRLLDGWRPDVVIAAARGYTVQATLSLVANTPQRPVLVSGIAGVSIPVLPYGLGFRRSVDVFVTHSHHELAESQRVSRRVGIPIRFELGTLPYLAAARAVRPEPRGRRRIVFAAQALVPSSRRDRQWLVEKLAETARQHPDVDVVVKVRARAGETQTHHEQVGYEELVSTLREEGRAPENLLVEDGPMRRHLEKASGFVTVSSTALLEAVAAGVPVLAIDDFGVGAAQINVVLEGSGVLAGAEELVAGRFRTPDPQWVHDNYFHHTADDTWADAVQGLLAVRAFEGLPPYRELPRSWMNSMREVWYREFAFRTGRTGWFAWAERRFLHAALTLNRGRWRLITALSGRPSPRERTVEPEPTRVPAP
ncbi:glycosyltransferase [Aeromicrobium sp. Root495]|uniref:glycosyltransferase n=1 Tax=Aeromicrobium sp. Root495 TaxID=1736550 RepID=UPI0012E8684C|nr:glycosyltransferase [Aeromicrobium sp. Root495]